MTYPNEGTQNWHVLHWLERGPVCSGWIYGNTHITHRLAARIYDLRTKYGWNIVSAPCKQPAHEHRSPMAEYRLVEVGQEALF